MKNIKILTVLLAWYFLMGSSASLVAGRGWATVVGPFGSYERCSAMREEVANSKLRPFYLSRCWSDTKEG